jgi:hypothetical protein
MTIRSKVLAAAAALALAGGVGTAGVLGTAVTANAATPSCGITCLDIFSQEFGHHFAPNYLLDVFQQHITIGQPIILFRASNNDKAEDFRPEFQGTVADFYLAGMVSAAFALHYGCVPGDSPGGPDCFGFSTIALGHPLPEYGLPVVTCKTSSIEYNATLGACVASFNDPAFEIEYTPDGVDSGLCAGVASTAVSGEKVTLQECGASSKTVWAVDLYDQPLEAFVHGYAPLVNGSDTNFSQPYVLTYPLNGFPTDKPRPQLEVDNLSGYTQGFPPLLNYASIDDDQMWGADLGA